ncbi:TetR/AcrR family transcriptional regulator [Actinokineospora bangkokensis]|uniref:TetR family transcriptional regulator n=1 Tax=Actinokineospora bangkokensis TaxID=1193682 RepID=A0A1Q9LPP9_9PSEU|nr:TetR/AcrR family transcriptional regulator C-terminal domain-containing protein [Actinokineospora bangkokensis]OLR94008.1 TetR family transcriptional regulator [Actinokineospora bangkokensis]
MPGRPGPRRTLSAEVITDAALGLLDDGGAEALSMRRIAAAAGVAPNALYTYFPDKAAVLRAVVDRLVGRHANPALTGDAPWRDRVRAMAVAVRAGLLAHPGAAAMIMSAPLDGPEALRFGELLLDALAEAGVTGPDAARASYAVMVYLLGAIALEAADQGADPGARRAAAAAIPAEHFPRTAASAAVIATYNTVEQYLWGLDRLVDGLVR